MTVGYALFLLISLCYGDMNVTGRIDVITVNAENKTNIESLSSKKFKLGDVINFSFVLNFTGTKDLASIDLHISGTSLKILWSIPNGGISVGMKTELLPGTSHLGKINQEIKPSADRSYAIVSLINNNIPIHSAYGRFIMKVTDLTHIRSMIDVIPSIGDPSSIYSESVPVFIPSFSSTKADPPFIKMKEVTSFNVDIDLPYTGVQNSYAKLYMPYNDKVPEAKLTVLNFDASSITATDAGVADVLNQLKGGLSRFSQSSTTEEDSAVFSFPSLNFTTVNNGGIHYTLICQGILQDFVGYGDGSEMEIAVGFKFNEEFIWISTTNVSIADNETDDSKRPLLNSIMDEFQRSSEHGIVESKMRLTIIHDMISTGTAYDVTINFYFPPTVSYLSHTKRFYDIVKKVNENHEPGIAVVELPRISFPHVSRMVFNITVDTNSDEVYLKEIGIIPILFEVVYKGWRSEENYTTSVQAFNLVLGNDMDEEEDIKIGENCPCSGQEEDRSCACCRKHFCQCGTQNRDKCVSCDNMYHCVDTLLGYYQTSYVQDRNGTMYLCDDRNKMRHGRPYASCMAELASGDEQGMWGYMLRTCVPFRFSVLSPHVSIILGTDFESGVLYGLSNNGQGYVASPDGGESWYSIPEKVYINAVTSLTFLKSTVI